jgi:hydroxyethylthiazole kinase
MVMGKLEKVLKYDMAKIRATKPLIHHITNYVAMNDSANATLAIGASPIMAHAHGELREIVSVASTLLINIGTLDDYWIQSMFMACEFADRRIPILLDPVGAGATELRTMTAQQILSRFKISVVKGNYGEIMGLMGEENAVKGVDSLSTDFQTVANVVKEFALLHNTVAVATGEIDVFSDGKDSYILKNGTEKLGKITASGCMLGSIMASFLAVQKDPLVAAIEGAAVYEIAGELAGERATEGGSFRTALIDSISMITPEMVMERISIEKI